MFRLAILISLPLLILSSGRVDAQSPSFRVAASAGYDEDILGRPGDPANLASTGNEGFFRLSPAVEARFFPGSWLLAGAYNYTFNRYGSDQAGIYHDHLGWAAARWDWAPRLSLLLDGSAEIFRRTEYPRDDVNQLEGGGRLEYFFRPGWAGTAGVFLGRNQFTGRPVGESDQIDNTLEVETALFRRFGAENRLSLRLALLGTGSNEAVARYDGWRGGLSGKWIPGRLGTIDVRASYERRSYDQNPLADGPGSRAPRDDWFTQMSVELGRPLGPVLRTFGRLSWLDYHSNVRGYSYNSTTASAGVELTFGPRERDLLEEPSGLPIPDLAPRVSGTTVTFRHRAPGARTVTVTGSFNSWDPGQYPLEDQDGDGVWEARITLAPGRYRYMFLVDGQSWERPEQAPVYEDDGFGFENGVIDVH